MLASCSNEKGGMWLILDADEGVRINFSFRDKTDRRDFEEAIETSHTDKGALDRFLNPISVKLGEVYPIPEKAVHACIRRRRL